MEFDYNVRLKDIHFVRLESSRSERIGEISNIFLTKERIVIIDLRITQSVFIFSANGKFIKRIGIDTDNSPASIDHIASVAYDYAKNEIIVYNDEKKSFYYFDKDGSFRGEEQSYIFFEKFCNIGGSKYYAYISLLNQNPHITSDKVCNLYLGEKGTRILRTADNAIQRLKIKANYVQGYCISQTNKNVYFTPTFSDTIYKITTNPLNVFPKFALHFPDKDIISKVKLNPNMTMQQYVDLLNSHLFYSFQGKVFSLRDSIYYFEVNRKEAIGLFYSIKTNKFIGGGIKTTLQKTDTCKTEYFNYPIASTNDEFVSVIDPKRVANMESIVMKPLRTPILTAALANMTVKDNPILVFYKLKDF
jgi:hypothetical protein